MKKKVKIKIFTNIFLENYLKICNNSKINKRKCLMRENGREIIGRKQI